MKQSVRKVAQSKHHRRFPLDRPIGCDAVFLLTCSVFVVIWLCERKNFFIDFDHVIGFEIVSCLGLWYVPVY